MSQVDGNADISLSAGNTGVLLVISRMILKAKKCNSSKNRKYGDNHNKLNQCKSVSKKLLFHEDL